MVKNFVRLLAVCTCLLAAVIPSTASAAGGGGGGAPGVIAISVGPTVELSGKQILTATVTVNCPVLLDPSTGLPLTDNFGFLQIQEVRGNTIAHAFGNFTFACDGLDHTVVVTALAQDHPFRRAAGVAAASAGTCGLDPTTLAFICVNGAAIEPVAIK
ncbi:MAG TPA: hypothetical protein VGK42_12015 [Candidatus Dormibacteraeota bacterium]|jgi:hypothetical protein